MQFDQLRRREFVTLLGGAAAWPLAASAQQGERIRRIGVLMGGLVDSDPEGQARVTAFREGLQQLGLAGGSQRAHRLSLGDVRRRVDTAVRE
jgi:putative ABC transport system substrate-binding protein